MTTPAQPLDQFDFRQSVQPTRNYNVIESDGAIIKAWNNGVPFEEKAIEQLKNTAKMPFIHKWIAAMPDCHWGMGSTVGTVLPTKGAIIPAAVGVDIGCGMLAAKTNLNKTDLFKAKTDLPGIRNAIERRVPSGRTNNGARGDRGAWFNVPPSVQMVWDTNFAEEYERFTSEIPGARAQNTVSQLGTLGTGNHFIELVSDDNLDIWIVLHSGSRGLGNKIGSYFTGVAKELCEKWFVSLPDPDLAYLPKDTPEYKHYLYAVQLAQRFAWSNRTIMLSAVIEALTESVTDNACLVVDGRGDHYVHCHHNYIAHERHFGENVLVTRKGAVRAQEGEYGIIPGSMGARTYIVKGLGNRDSFCSCSHGAGRAMGRSAAMKKFSVEDHVLATAGVECDKSVGTLDETPGAYKSIEAVMAAQADLVTPVHRLRQFICVKGISDGRR